MTNFIYHSGLATRGLSPKIWANEILRRGGDDPSQAPLFFDEFNNFSQHITAQNVQGYASYIDTGVTIKQLAALDGSEGECGVLEIAGNDADNDEGSITAGGNSGTEAVITDSAGEQMIVAFECRVKKASVADNALAFFVGLSEEGLAGADTLVDNTGALADKDFVGFQVLQNDGDSIDAVWRKEGGAVTNPTSGTDIHTMVADTWVKLGFLYVPGTTNPLGFYVDGELKVSATAANIAAATFPDGEELTRLLATKVGTAAESKFQMDWWALGVAFPDYTGS